MRRILLAFLVALSTVSCATIEAGHWRFGLTRHVLRVDDEGSESSGRSHADTHGASSGTVTSPWGTHRWPTIALVTVRLLLDVVFLPVTVVHDYWIVD